MLVRAVLLFLVVFVVGSLAAPPGSLKGAVLSQGGQPIAGAYVIARRLSPNTPKAFYEAEPGSLSVETIRADGQGRFALSLPTGTYELCVQTSGETHVDPCEWSSAPPRTYIDSVSDQGVELRVEETSPVEIEVDDSDQIIARAPQPGAPAGPSAAGMKAPVQLSFGVWTRRGFRVATTPVARSASLVYTFRGPAGRDYTIHAVGEGFELENDKGKKLNHTAPVLNVRAERGKVQAIRLKIRRK